jgi:hypothetical protein
MRASLFLATILPRWFGKFALEGGFLSSLGACSAEIAAAEIRLISSLVFGACVPHWAEL